MEIKKITDLESLKNEELNGWYRIPDAVYHGSPGISVSGLLTMLKSPYHYYWEYVLGNRKEPTDAMIFGTLMHEALLQPNEFKQCYTTAQELGLNPADYRKKEFKTAVSESEKTGKRVIKHEIYQSIQGVLESIYKHPTASKFLLGGMAEIAAYWKDPTGGILCRGKLDYIREDGILGDLKTCADASTRAFERQVTNLNYHVRAAYYGWGYKILTGRDPKGFVVIAIEKTPPFQLQLFQIDIGSIEKGMEVFLKLLNTYRECAKNGVWPGYPTDVQSIAILPWAFQGE